LALIVALCSAEGRAQQAVSFKHFSSFKGLVPAVDFYASKRQSVTPYEKPTAGTISKLQTLLGSNLPKGAIFICSTLQQKDAVYEPMVLKAGYGWTLTIITPEVRMQEMLDRVKSQMGGEVPAEIQAEMKSRMGNMQQMTAEYEKRMVDTTTQQMAHAVIWALLDKESQFRSTRLDDMTKSPLPDWMDIGIASYASGVDVDLSFLQQHMDETFPLDDVLAMSRPFVASTFGTNQGSGGSFRGRGGMSGGGDMSRFGGMSGGGGMPRFGGMSGGGDMPRFGGGSGGGMGVPPSGFGSRGSGGSGGRGRNGGNSQRVLPKDEQDQMLFDAQSGTFFSYMLEKVGIEKMKELVQQAIEGHETRDFVVRPDVLGSNMDQIEKDWASWVKTLSPQKS